MQPIYNIAEICARKHVKNFIISPGSRCAPLTIALARHPEIDTKTISDERSAAFIAIGISQQTKSTTGLLCTSGSAAYNYAPAVAEAYYQQIPLLILTADRPPEWIDQLDGQTIRQTNIFGSHVKNSYTLPVDLSHPDSKWHIERTISDAINLSQEFPQGPVHVNIPLREPFYPESEIVFDKNVKVISQVKGETNLPDEEWNQIQKELKSFKKILIVGGQDQYDSKLVSLLDSISTQHYIPVIGDIISNLSKENIIHSHDAILSCKDEEMLDNLKPDLLITFGKSLISKSLKVFLRKTKPTHWHIQSAGHVADTFQSLTKIISISPSSFFKNLKGNTFNIDPNYISDWKYAEKKAIEKTTQYFNTSNTFSEFTALNFIFHSLPSNSDLHLANSMPVRYANYLPLKDKSIEVFANRGTSGIDGTISTAYGAALKTEKIVTVITGDMAFFYDRNALWNNYTPSNLRIVILNNHGGGIFKMIDGPSGQPELEEYFVTKQKLVAENTAKDFNFGYHFIKNENELKDALKTFFKHSDRPQIIEIETDSTFNTKAFKEFKKLLSVE